MCIKSDITFIIVESGLKRFFETIQIKNITEINSHITLTAFREIPIKKQKHYHLTIMLYLLINYKRQKLSIIN